MCGGLGKSCGVSFGAWVFLGDVPVEAEVIRGAVGALGTQDSAFFGGLPFGACRPFEDVVDIAGGHNVSGPLCF